VDGFGLGSGENFELIERIRSRLLSMEPRRFEIFIRDLLGHSGFNDVCVTKYSADGGIDVNARTGRRFWIFENTLVQVQAKRWLHSVGRKEVAELRGSLRPARKGRGYNDESLFKGGDYRSRGGRQGFPLPWLTDTGCRKLSLTRNSL
jgi:restriction endonuclease Mrr